MPGIPGYWCVAPKPLLRDKRVKSSALRLYLEISALCEETGYCWATNAYLAQIMEVGESTISRLVTQLERCGYIRTEMAVNGSRTGSERHIYAGVFMGEVPAGGCPQKEQDPPGGCSQKAQDPRGVSSKTARPVSSKTANRIRGNSNITVNNTPPTPPDKKIKLDDDARPLLNDYVRGDRAMAEAMMDLMEIRTAKKAVNSYRGIKNLLAELDRLSGGDRQMKLLLLQQSAANGWKSVFPLRVNGRGTPTSGGEAEKVKSELSTWTDD